MWVRYTDVNVALAPPGAGIAKSKVGDTWEAKAKARAKAKRSGKENKGEENKGKESERKAKGKSRPKEERVQSIEKRVMS